MVASRRPATPPIPVLMPTPSRFEATLYRLGINFCFDVPAEASGAFGDGPFVPVRGEANDVEFATTLVPRGGGEYRLFLDGRVREAASLAEGDTVEIAIERDEHPPEPHPPDELLAALDATEGGVETFFALRTDCGARHCGTSRRRSARRPSSGAWNASSSSCRSACCAPDGTLLDRTEMAVRRRGSRPDWPPPSSGPILIEGVDGHGGCRATRRGE